MPKLVEAFGSSNFASLHVWQDGASLRIGVPSYERERGGAFVAFTGEQDAKAVLALAHVLARWAVASGATKEAEDAGVIPPHAPGGGE